MMAEQNWLQLKKIIGYIKWQYSESQNIVRNNLFYYIESKERTNKKQFLHFYANGIEFKIISTKKFFLKNISQFSGIKSDKNKLFKKEWWNQEQWKYLRKL